MKLTSRDPTVELMGPKKGKIIARNHIGITTGSLARALLYKLFVLCIPMNFSHTKYSGVHANPNVINCTNIMAIIYQIKFVSNKHGVHVNKYSVYDVLIKTKPLTNIKVIFPK